MLDPLEARRDRNYSSISTVEDGEALEREQLVLQQYQKSLTYRTWIIYTLYSALSYGIVVNPCFLIFTCGQFIFLYVGYARLKLDCHSEYLVATLITAVLHSLGFSYSFCNVFTDEMFSTSVVTFFVGVVVFLYVFAFSTAIRIIITGQFQADQALFFLLISAAIIAIVASCVYGLSLHDGKPSFGIVSAALGCGYSLIIVFSLSVHIYYSQRFPQTIARYFIFPTLYCCVSLALYGYIGSYISIAYAATSYPALRYTASIGGIFLIEFLISYVTISLGGMRCNAHVSTKFFIGSLFLILGGITIAYIWKDGSLVSQPYSTFSAACITSPQVPYHSSNFTALRNITATEARYNSLVLWSEAAVSISSIEEPLFLADMSKLAASTSSYMGITYLQQENNGVMLNRLAFISSTGEMLWKYTKAHAVLSPEGYHTSNTGIKTASTPLGTVSGAIGYDLDFEHYMQQQRAVDIMLQPDLSTIRGSLAARQYNSAAMRALENGFALLRCAWNGVSGVVSVDGDIVSQIAGMPQSVYHFSVPLQGKRSTLYKSFGVLLRYVVYISSAIILVLLVLPKGWILRISQATNIFPDQVAW